ncbi:38896_t:CDS:2, partial [Gigaspora margarita]
MANSIFYYSNICNFKSLANEIIIKQFSSLYTRLNSAKPEAETLEIQFLQESIILQDSVTRKIKDNLCINADLKGLAILNLQRLLADKRIKDWVITKKIDSKPILGHIVKKNSNSVLIKHWKKLDHLVLSQSKLKKYRKCSLSVDSFYTLMLSKEKILGTFPKNSFFFETISDKTNDLSIDTAWIQVDKNEFQVIEQSVYGIRNWLSSTKPKLLAILMALYTVSEKKMVKIFTD